MHPTILTETHGADRSLGQLEGEVNTTVAGRPGGRVVRSVVSRDQVRKLALALPEVIEQDHHGRPSFRVAGRIFATLWDQEHMNVLLDEPGILTAVQARPGVCAEFWWGKRLRAAQVDLGRADEQLIGELLTDAWEQKAPKRLVEATRQVAD
jgi:hypothetical protein